MGLITNIVAVKASTAGLALGLLLGGALAVAVHRKMQQEEA